MIMTAPPSSRRWWPWAAALLLSLAVAFAAIDITRRKLESSYQEVLGTEVKRRALEIDAVTMSGNVMGSVATLGLVNPSMKGVARGVIPLQDPLVMETLGAIGEAYQANGVYVAKADGIVQSCWYTMGVTLTGVDIKFRPYFQIALQGKQNVYAAIGTTTGQRSLYFAAPLYGEVSHRAPVIGITVARLGLARVDSVLNAWKSGPALLLSPQDVTFASNRPEWNEHLAGQPTAEKLEKIRKLKQFGLKYDQGTPNVLPFDPSHEIVSIDRIRYAVARALVHWNDPNGDWSLTLLGGLDAVMPAARRAWIGLSSGLATFVLSALFLAWRRRLRHVRAQQAQAEIELKAYASQLEFDSATKSYLSEVSNELHQAESLAAFARIFMYRIAPRVAADYAAFYALDEASQRLIPVGGHGASPQDLPSVDRGQGLIGQCAKDMTPITLAGAADSAARIVWGQGAVAAKAILYLPVHQAGRLLGVIVLAAQRDFDAEKRALLDAMLPMLAMNLEILKRNLATQQQAAAIRQAAQRLADQLAFQQVLIDTIPYPVFYKGADTCFLGFNRAYEQAFAIKRENLVGKRVLDLDYLPEAERTACQAEDEQVVAEAGTVQREMPIAFADGKIHDTLYFVSGFRLADGSPGGLVGTFIDLAERRKVEDLELLINDRTQKLEKTAAGVGQLVALLSEFKSDAAQECLLEIARDLDIRS